MKRSASGPRVRPLSVMMSAAKRRAGKRIGSLFSCARFPLNCTTEAGSMPTKWPPAEAKNLSAADQPEMKDQLRGAVFGRAVTLAGWWRLRRATAADGKR